MPHKSFSAVRRKAQDVRPFRRAPSGAYKMSNIKKKPKPSAFLKQKLRAPAFRPTGGTHCRKKLVVERSKNNRAKAIVIFTGAKT